METGPLSFLPSWVKDKTVYERAEAASSFSLGLTVLRGGTSGAFSRALCRLPRGQTRCALKQLPHPASRQVFTPTQHREMGMRQMRFLPWVGQQARLELGLPCAPRKVLGRFWASVSLSGPLRVVRHMVVGEGVVLSAATTWAPRLSRGPLGGCGRGEELPV